MTDLTHTLARELVIRAERATVFAFLTQPERFARWWGAGSTVDARVGGALRIVQPGGVVAEGRVLALEAPARIAFSYGYANGQPMLSGTTRVDMHFAELLEGTHVRLVHACADAAVRDAHVDGWRYQLARLAGLACDDQHAALSERCDAWFAAWNEAEAVRRDAHLAACTIEAIEFRDAFGCVVGRADLAAHMAAARRHMPGLHVERVGVPRQVQGRALVEWRVPGPDGTVTAQGTNALELAPDGRLASVTGFWGPR